VNDTSPPDVPGHTIDRVVGRGATSVVWAGQDAMGRQVAVKVPHAGADVIDVMQSATERHVLTALRHDHLISLRDVVPLEDGRVATVFDLVDGASLRSMVTARGHLRPGETVTVLTPICDAVATLHRAGATHGDISPGNALVTAGGRPLLADLGAARVAGAGGAMLGTPGFAAPEVVAGEQTTEAADVYALGALAWFCLTGNGAPDTPIRLSPEIVSSHVGPELAEVVGACIDPEPARRPSGDRLAQLFYAAAAAEPIEVVVGGDEASALTHRIRAAAAASSPQPTPPRTGGVGRAVARARSALRPRARGRVAVGLVSLALLGSLGGWAGWSGVVRESADDVLAAPVAASPSGAAAARSLRATPAGQGRSVPTPVPASGTGTGTAVDVTGDPAAPRARPAELMRVLAERRALLLLGRDVASLEQVHVRSSPSWQADAGLLDTLRKGGQRYEGLRVAGVQARHVSASTSKAVIRARVDLSAYTVVDEYGGRTPRAAVTGELLDFALMRTGSGWRVEAITVPAST
jgi:hypothetical protein